MLTFNDQIDAIRRKIADIAIARVNGQSYALPVWSVDYPSIPADLVDTLLASFNVPSMAALEAELLASQAAATGVDVSRGIDATSVVTAPAAPSDTTAPVVTAPVVTAPVVTAPVVTAPVVTEPVADFSDLTSPLALPGDWDSYSEAFKIAWFNANQIKPSQLISAGVTASEIAYMRANGYSVKEQAPAAGGGGGGAAILLALASAYFLGA